MIGYKYKNTSHSHTGINRNIQRHMCLYTKVFFQSPSAKSAHNSLVSVTRYQNIHRQGTTQLGCTWKNVCHLLTDFICIELTLYLIVTYQIHKVTITQSRRYMCGAWCVLKCDYVCPCVSLKQFETVLNLLKAKVTNRG